MYTPLEGALFLVENHNATVFPLAKNSKIPMKGFAWRTLGVNTKKEVEAFSIKYPGCNWAVDTERSGFAVIDLDKKGDKNGVDAFRKLAKENAYNKIDTLMVATPGQGYHLIYKGSYKSGANVIDNGIDIRSRGGYIVALGSVIDKKHYTLKKNIAPVDVPVWVGTKLNAISEAKKEQVKSEETINEPGRNVKLTSIAGSMRSAGCGQKEIEILLTTINEDRVFPPLGMHEIRTIARSVSNYPVEDAKNLTDLNEINGGKDEGKPFLFTPNDIDDDEDLRIPWVAEGRYARRYLTVGIAKGGVGKTMFLFADLLGISVGKDFLNFGNQIHKCNTWLHSTEDDDVDLKRRAKGVMKAHKVTKKEAAGFFLSSGRKRELKIALMLKGMPIKNTPHIEEIKKHIKDNKIGVFALDPFSGCHGLSENDNTHMVLVKDILNDIAEECNCAVVVLHHSRKKSGKGQFEVEDARGASALTDGARTVLVFNEMTEDQGKELKVKRWANMVRVSFVKSNNAPPKMTKPIWFERFNVEDDNAGDIGAARAFSVECNSLVEENDEEVSEKGDIDRGSDSSNSSDSGGEPDSGAGLPTNKSCEKSGVELPPPEEKSRKLSMQDFHTAIDDTCSGLNKRVAALALAKRIGKALPDWVNSQALAKRLLRYTEDGKVLNTEIVSIKRAKSKTGYMVVFNL
jgi:hypothetical protein